MKVTVFIILSIVLCYTAAHTQKLEVAGALKVGTDSTKVPGSIRFNPINNDFEGYNGIDWYSLTGGIKFEIGSVEDYEGHSYKTIIIGSLEIMAENLRAAKYNDGTFIDKEISGGDWGANTTGAWIWYDNNFNYEVPYGKLYNFHAVYTGKLCPTNWHVPTFIEWMAIIDTLGGIDIAGGKMKTRGQEYWMTNTEGSNESGFSGLPGGRRSEGGFYQYLGSFGYYWSSTLNSTSMLIPTSAKTIRLLDESDDLEYLTNNAKDGLSIRCMKN